MDAQCYFIIVRYSNVDRHVTADRPYPRLGFILSTFLSTRTHEPIANPFMFVDNIFSLSIDIFTIVLVLEQNI